MAHVPKNPAIPMREGVSPSCVALPRLRVVPWPGLLDFLAERLPAVSREGWHQRLAQGDVVDDNGRPLPPDAPYVNGARIYYWRALPDEPAIPFAEHIVFRDEHLVVADKPHFLPVTPGGRYVRETLLVRLKRTLGLPDLSPLHRIDRETAGLVVFSVRPQDRDAYQRLFRERTIHKTYEAIGPAPTDWRGPVWRRSRIEEDPQAFYRMVETDGTPNSETRIDLLETQGTWARFRLEPVTGRRHQLRVHMNALGLPLHGDQFYPSVRRQPGETEDFAEPLALLARSLAFDDPVTGTARRFESQRVLTPPTP